MTQRFQEEFGRFWQQTRDKVRAYMFCACSNVSDADDLAHPKLGRITLRLGVHELVSADRLEVEINGEPVSFDGARRRPLQPIAPYTGQWLDLHLRPEQLRQGANELRLALGARPTGLAGEVRLEDVEVLVEYDTYPSGQQA